MDVSNSNSFLFDFPPDLISNPPPSRRKRSSKPPVAFRSRYNMMARERPPTPISPTRDGLLSSFDLPPIPPYYSRRSVSGMKNLMPLKLASPPTSAQTSPVIDSPGSFRSAGLRKPSSRDTTPIPWMSSSSSVPQLGHVNPKRYRETPIYSEPNSPQLARAYFRSPGPSYCCGPPGSPCEELCIVKSYKESLDDSSETLEEFSDCLESLDGDAGLDSDDDGSISTAPTSLPSARFSGSSELSIKCRGLPPRNDGLGLESSAIPALAEPFDGTASRIATPTDLRKWIESDESHRSSTNSMFEIADVSATEQHVLIGLCSLSQAFATPLALAPVKANIVKVASPDTPTCFPPRTTSLSQPAKLVTTPGWASRRMSTLDYQPSTPEKPIPAPLNKIMQSTIKVRKARPAPLDITTPPFNSTTAINPAQPLISRLLSPFREALDYTKSTVPRYKFEVHDVADEVLAIPLVEAICDTIDGSPRDLQLDSYCITEIRRLNRLIRAASRPAPPPLPIPVNQEVLDKELKRVRRSKSFFGTFKTSSRTSQFPSRKSSFANSASVPRQVQGVMRAETKVDLSALRTIFPGSDDWWRSVLYAHVLAYTYVSQKQSDTTTVSGTNRPPSRPPKATKTLGLSLAASLPLATDTAASERDTRESFEVILTALASCISRIIAVMKGAEDYNLTRSRIVGHNAYGRRREEMDWPFVRALAEMIKIAELGAGAEAC